MFFNSLAKKIEIKPKKKKQRKCLKKKEYIIETFYKKRDMKSNVLITEINVIWLRPPRCPKR